MKSRQKSDRRSQRFSEDWQQAVLKLRASTTNSTALSPEITKSEPAGQTHTEACCKSCGVVLTEENWVPSLVKKDERVCKICWNTKYNAKTNPRHNPNRMYVNGKYVPKTHPLYKPGRYKGFEEAAFSSLENFKDSLQGEVYVITNPAWPEWVKVGMAVESEDRLKNYQTSSPFRDYTIVYTYEVDDRRAAESAAHVRLAKECDNINEWFRLPPPIANELILEVIHEY